MDFFFPAWLMSAPPSPSGLSGADGDVADGKPARGSGADPIPVDGEGPGRWPDPPPAPDGQLPLTAAVPGAPDGGGRNAGGARRRKKPARSANGDRPRPAKGPSPASANGANGRKAAAPPAAYVDCGDLLPTAHPADGGMLATLLGFDEHSARFVTAVGENGWENPQTAPSAWDMLPSLDDVSPDPVQPDGRAGNTGDAVKRLWDATEQMDLSPRHDPDYSMPVDHMSRPRRMRWPLILITAGILAAGVFAVWELTNRSTEAVSARQAEHAAAAQTLDSSLQPLELRLASITALGGWDEDVLSGLAGELGRLDGAARRALTLAGEELPDSPLPVSSGSPEELAAARETLEGASARALILEQRLAAMVAYVQPWGRAFNLPELPERAASPEEAGAVSAALNESLVGSRAILDGLPDNPDFATHRTEATRALTQLESRQDDYLTALRTGDAAGAGAAARNLSQLTIALDRLLAGQQGPVIEWAQGEINNLRSELRAAVAG